MMHRKNAQSDQSSPPPVASYETQRAYSRTTGVLAIFQAIYQATKGVFVPGPDDPKTLYGRIFRFVGLIFVYVFIAMLIFVAVQDFLKGLRR
jgi:hypothetical protein